MSDDYNKKKDKKNQYGIKDVRIGFTRTQHNELRMIAGAVGMTMVDFARAQVMAAVALLSAKFKESLPSATQPLGGPTFKFDPDELAEDVEDVLDLLPPPPPEDNISG